ncbi:MAG: TIGR02206 family membrane protein [Gammaproteobacteria bacterium]|nr:TIGR02206 family membrane protein [Gammaproteobacteria bacterium]|tara:strand:+ start:26069 stop:26758 length:690 start_codon:yes stop_codon:yes gene_type:complete
MIDFNLSSPSHILITLLCIFIIIFLPRLFLGKNKQSKNILMLVITSLILINQGMDFYREGIMDDWRLGLPLHLCDFSSASIILYFITKRRELFVFAYFAGIAGAGMAILTPDVLYSFPHIDYLRHMIGHSMILLGVSYAMIVENERPQLKDVHRVLIFISILLVLMYLINYLLGPPANYWYVFDKPPGFNVTEWMREAPFHMIDIYVLAVIVCYLIYLPYFIKDRIKTR